MSREARLYVETNLSPVAGPNPLKGKAGQPDWIRNHLFMRYALDKGFEPSFMLYDGTINRALTWADDAGSPRPPHREKDGNFPWDLGIDLDWGREAQNSNPPDKSHAALTACGTLARRPWTYEGTGFAHTAIAFDVEAWGTYPDPWAGDPDLWERQCRAIGNAVHDVKNASPYSRVMWYNSPYFGKRGDTRLYDDYQRFNGQAFAECDVWNPFFYFWDGVVENPYSMFDSIDAVTKLLDRGEYQHKPRVATIHPWWCVYWPQQSARAKRDRSADLMPLVQGAGFTSDLWPRVPPGYLQLEHNRTLAGDDVASLPRGHPLGATGEANGKPVPPDFWEVVARYLMERDYDLWFWDAGHSLEQIRTYIDRLAKIRVTGPLKSPEKTTSVRGKRGATVPTRGRSPVPRLDRKTNKNRSPA